MPHLVLFSLRCTWLTLLSASDDECGHNPTARDIPSSGLSARIPSGSVDTPSPQLVIQSTYLPLIKALNNSISPNSGPGLGRTRSHGNGQRTRTRRERKLAAADADAQDPPLALVCCSCRTPGLRLWPFIVSARNGHTVPLIQQIQIAADLFLFGAPLFCILNGPKNWKIPLHLPVKDFDYEKAD